MNCKANFDTLSRKRNKLFISIFKRVIIVVNIVIKQKHYFSSSVVNIAIEREGDFSGSKIVKSDKECRVECTRVENIN